MIMNSLIPAMIIGLFSLAGCVPELEERIRNKKEKEAPPPAVTEAEVTAAELQPGVTQGTIPANQRATMRAGSSSIVVEPGTFAVDVPVTMEDGDTLTGEATTVGVAPNEVAAQGQALVVTAPEGTTPNQPFTIAMPIPAAGLTLLDDRQARLVVLFKVVVPGTGQLLLGVLSGDKLVIDGANVKFLATRFGSYQVVLLTKPAPPSSEVAAVAPIKRKRDTPVEPKAVPVAIPALALKQEAAAAAAIGVTAEALITVTNTGDGAKGLVLKLVGDTWTLKDDGCKGALAAGASCQLALYFTPSRFGKNPGRLFVVLDGADGKELASLELDGTGLRNVVLEASLDAATPTLAFKDAVEIAVSVTNDGEVTSGRVFAESLNRNFDLVQETAANVLSAAGSKKVCEPLAPKAKCTFKVRFVSPGEGVYRTDLTITTPLGVGASITAEVQGAAATTLSVAPAIAGAKWLDFYARDASEPLWLQASPGTPCSHELVAAGACYHAGEVLRADVPGFTDCTSLTARDAIGAFQWHCHDFGPTVAMFATGLRTGKGLRDLLNATSWKQNILTVSSSGTPVLRSAPVAWHANNVAEATLNVNDGDGLVSLASPGTIWTVAASRASEGYLLAGDSQALVTLGDAVLSPTTDYHKVSYDATAGADLCALIAASGRKALWIEATLDGRGLCDRAVFLKASNRATIRGSRIVNFTHSGISIGDSYGPRLFDVRVANSSTGVRYDEVEGGLFHHINVSNNPLYGLALLGGGEHTITSAWLAGNGEGIKIASSDGPAEHVTLNRVTFANNQNKGLYIGPKTAGVEAVGLLATNALVGISAVGVPTEEVTAVRVTDYFSFGNTQDFNIGHATVAMKGQLLHNSNCATGTDGVLNLNTNCTPTGGDVDSAARSGTGSFRGNAPFDDKNQSDADGVAPYDAATFDWLNYDSFWRVWMRADGARGPCSSDSCKIVDLSLAAGASPARNRSADYVGGHAPLVPGAACPAAAAPTRWALDGQATPNKFLINALEQMGDGVGDDDGLCEASERCIYAPAFGAYQGSGGLTTACTTGIGTVGDVTNVTLQAFENE